MKLLRECKTEEEKQRLRDEMLEHMYYQVLETHRKVSAIQQIMEECGLWQMKQKLKQLFKN
jgi:hypothetical protein